MPLSVFAALELRPGPDSDGLWLNGSVAVPTACGKPTCRGADGREERGKRSAALERLAERMLHDPARRARVIRRWWFGRRATGGGNARRWRVVISEEGVPHAIRFFRADERGGAGGGGGGGGSGMEAVNAADVDVAGAEVDVAGAEAGEGDAAGAPLFQKLSARRKWEPRELLAARARVMRRPVA